MEQIRSFIAIELPEGLKSKLSQIQTQLKATGHAPVKWVDPYSIHLTLKFLGNINANKVSEITGIIESASQGVSPFQLEVKDLGAFPNLRRPQVIWVGTTGELSMLSQLQQRIESGLEPLGFARESRKFTPHLTLARLRERVSPDEQQNIGQLVASIEFGEAFIFTVEHVSLMKSQLTREGAIYHRIGSAKLKKPLLKAGG